MSVANAPHPRHLSDEPSCSIASFCLLQVLQNLLFTAVQIRVGLLQARAYRCAAGRRAVLHAGAPLPRVLKAKGASAPSEQGGLTLAAFTSCRLDQLSPN